MTWLRWPSRSTGRNGGTDSRTRFLATTNSTPLHRAAEVDAWSRWKRRWRGRGQARLIPAAAAAAIGRTQPASTSRRCARDGSVGRADGIARRISQGVDDGAASALHFGATSQDVMDTGPVLRLRDAFAILTSPEKRHRRAGRLPAHRATVMFARTRWQALPTTFGAGSPTGWRHHPASPAPRRAAARLLSVQLGGAAGTLSAMGPGRAADGASPRSSPSCPPRRGTSSVTT
jgi:3-carboxy-cis,cis-muconate cycloisomerase